MEELFGRNVKGTLPSWVELNNENKIALQHCYSVVGMKNDKSIDIGGFVSWINYNFAYWNWSNSYSCRSDGGVARGYVTGENLPSAGMLGNITTEDWIKENIGKTTLDTYYKPDDFNKNNGYPVLNWEYEKWK